MDIAKDIADFYYGMREYWSTRTLMQGYGEAAKDITELVEDATHHSNPLIQACAGSGLAVAKIVVAIPLGIDHWVIETAKSTVHHGWGAGFKTLLGTPIEGFIGGGKFVLRQGKKWIRGEISFSTFGVADEVATTLGTAGLMFLGIKAIHSGGGGLIEGIKNIEIQTPALAYSTGQVMPVPLAPAGAFDGGPLAMGLVYMSSTNNSSKGGSTRGGKDGVDVQGELRADDLFQLDVKTVVKMSTVPELRSKILVEKINYGDPEALQALIQLIKNGDPFSQGKLVKLIIRTPYLEKSVKLQALQELMQLNDSSVLFEIGTLDRISDEFLKYDPENPASDQAAGASNVKIGNRR